MTAAVILACMGLCLSSGGAAAQAIEPSHAKLRDVSLELYPAILAREELEAPFVVGLLFDQKLGVVGHSGCIPPRRAVDSGLLWEMFPRLRGDECENAGFAVVRSPRGVGGQFDKGVFAVWCVLKSQ